MTLNWSDVLRSSKLVYTGHRFNILFKWTKQLVNGLYQAPLPLNQIAIAICASIIIFTVQINS